MPQRIAAPSWFSDDLESLLRETKAGPEVQFLATLVDWMASDTPDMQVLGYIALQAAHDLYEHTRLRDPIRADPRRGPHRVRAYRPAVASALATPALHLTKVAAQLDAKITDADFLNKTYAGFLTQLAEPYLWPLVPLLRDLYWSTRGQRRDYPIAERLLEIQCVILLTKPRGNALKILERLIKAVLHIPERPTGDSQVAEKMRVASDVLGAFASRSAGAAQYLPRAKTRDEAFGNVYKYMWSAVRQRANTAYGQKKSTAFNVPASTLRRWRSQGIEISTAREAARVQAAMKQKRVRKNVGRDSLQTAASKLGRVRSTVDSAVKKAVAAGELSPRRDSNGQYAFTEADLDVIRRHLPRSRRRG